MTGEKGYLKGAWDFAAALFTNPILAIQDVGRGLEKDIEDPALFRLHNFAAFGGLGMALTGVFMGFNPISLGVGLVGSFLGFGRHHAIGEAARFAEGKQQITEILPEAPVLTEADILAQGEKLIEKLDKKFDVDRAAPEGVGSRFMKLQNPEAPSLTYH